MLFFNKNPSPKKGKKLVRQQFVVPDQTLCEITLAFKRVRCTASDNAVIFFEICILIPAIAVCTQYHSFSTLYSQTEIRSFSIAAIFSGHSLLPFFCNGYQAHTLCACLKRQEGTKAGKEFECQQLVHFSQNLMDFFQRME